MRIKKIFKILAGVTLGPMVSVALRVTAMMQGIPVVREGLAAFHSALQASAHKSYERKVKARYDIHASVYWGEETLIYGDGEISIGEGSYIGKGSFLLAHPAGSTLRIGKHCSISHGVHLRTEKNKRKPHYKDDLASPPLGADVAIGDYVWIGAHVFIGGGVTVGENSIIGANSVVTRNVPPNSIWGGVPAKHIGSKDAYSTAGHPELPD